MASLYRKDSMHSVHHLLTGVVLTLKRQDAEPSAPDEDLLLCGDISELSVRFIISFLTCGMLVAECTLPTVPSFLHATVT